MKLRAGAGSRPGSRDLRFCEQDMHLFEFLGIWGAVYYSQLRVCNSAENYLAQWKSLVYFLTTTQGLQFCVLIIV